MAAGASSQPTNTALQCRPGCMHMWLTAWHRVAGSSCCVPPHSDLDQGMHLRWRHAKGCCWQGTKCVRGGLRGNTTCRDTGQCQLWYRLCRRDLVAREHCLDAQPQSTYM